MFFALLLWGASLGIVQAQDDHHQEAVVHDRQQQRIPPNNHLRHLMGLSPMLIMGNNGMNDRDRKAKHQRESYQTMNAPIARGQAQKHLRTSGSLQEMKNDLDVKTIQSQGPACYPKAKNIGLGKEEEESNTDVGIGEVVAIAPDGLSMAMGYHLTDTVATTPTSFYEYRTAFRVRTYTYVQRLRTWIPMEDEKGRPMIQVDFTENKKSTDRPYNSFSSAIMRMSANLLTIAHYTVDDWSNPNPAASGIVQLWTFSPFDSQWTRMAAAIRPTPEQEGHYLFGSDVAIIEGQDRYTMPKVVVGIPSISPDHPQ